MVSRCARRTLRERPPRVQTPRPCATCSRDMGSLRAAIEPIAADAVAPSVGLKLLGLWRTVVGGQVLLHVEPWCCRPDLRAGENQCVRVQDKQMPAPSRAK